MRSATVGLAWRSTAVALSTALAVATLTAGSSATEPAPVDTADHSITFVDQTPGEPPADWSTLWRDSEWTVEGDPARLVHEATTSGRQGLTPDAVGVVEGDVEVSGVVRPDTMTGTQQVLFLHASGEAGAENAYYVDFRRESSDRFGYRINRYLDGTFSTLAWSEQPDTMPRANEWYEIVFQRSGDDLRLKVWPYGVDEPDEWTVVASDPNHTSGRVGFGHTTGGRTLTEWAHLGVSTTGPAPRMPDGVFPPPRIPDAPAVEDGTTDHVASTRWDAVEGASYYEVERDGRIVASPWNLTAYADPVPAPDTTSTYRVRGVSAILGEGPWSEPIEVRSPGVRFPDHPTPFEDTGDLTSIDTETQFLDELSEASERVVIETIGTSVEDRDIRLVRVGYPTAPTDDEIRERPSLFVNCSVHGNEWTPREACLSFIRDLAMTTDPALLEVLETHGVIVNPTSNPDGRAANTRENAQGLDVNRDYLAFETPEARAVVDVVNRLDPDVVLDGHNCCDDSIVPDWSRHIGVSDAVTTRSEDLVTSAMIGSGEQLGYTARPSTLATGNLPVVARNYVGLRNRLGLLNEVRGAAITGRLDEAPPTADRTAHIRGRAVNAFEFVLHSTLGYLVEHSEAILSDNAAAQAEADEGTGPRYFGNTAETAVEPEVCGYRLTLEQLDEIAPVLEQHRIDVVTVAEAPVVSLAQPSGRVVAMLLDGRSDYALVDGEPVTGDECPTLKPVRPDIHGTATVGRTVVAKTRWQPAARLSFQWEVNGEPIAGATRPTLRITNDLVGQDLTVTVTGTRRGEVASATSYPVVVHRAPGTDPVVVSVEVSPPDVSVRAGDTAPLSAVARYDDGAEQDVTEVAEWTSSDAAVAEVDAAGVISAVHEGTAEITAAFDGRTGTASVTVVAPNVFSTDFKEDGQVVGEAPEGWTTLWGDGSAFEIADAPRRVVHTNTSGEQESMVFDAAGTIDYGMHAEVAGLVRLPSTSNPSGSSTRFQMHMQASGAAGEHNSFYTDATGTSVRLGRYLGGNYVGRGSAYSYAVLADEWHHVVMQRHDDVWRTKMWPYGEDEPDAWMVETARTTIDGGLPAGQPGFGHFAAGAISEWAWFSVAVDDASAPAVAERAPDDLFEPGPGASVTAVQIDPAEGEVETDDTLDLQAAAVYDDGAVRDVTTAAQWASDDETVVTVTADGMATGVAEGTATVTATFDGVTGTAEITVVDLLIPTTGFEDRDGAGWTTLEEEAAFLEAVAERSERMSYTEIGKTAEGRPLHLVRVGYPTAPSDDDIVDGHSVFVVGSQHGNEPAGREAALRHLRDAAFTDDPDVLAALGDITMMYIPTANPDGRAANRRTNSDGIDTNRDHLGLETAEATAIAEVVQEFGPQVVLDLHERPSGNDPDMELLWPRNLNVDEDLRDLNIDLVRNHLFPALQDAGFTTGLYGSPGGSGGGDERISRNVFGLRHTLGLLTETAGQDPPMYRVDAQALSIEQTLGFFHGRFDDVVAETSEAPARRQAHGAAQGPFYLGGRDDVSPPPADRTIDPGVCGYVVSASDADALDGHVELFGITTETLDDGRVFIGMDQPMMTIVPFLVDPRATYNVVNGLIAEDCDDLPEPPEAAQHSTSFTESDNVVGQVPAGWQEFRTAGDWSVQNLPRRLQAQIASGGRQGLMWDQPGNLGFIQGDAEVAGLVRGETTGNALFQIALHASGDGTDYYYVDAWPSNGNIRINRFVGNSFTTLSTVSSGIDVDNGEWYNVVFRREGDGLAAKIWPFGAEEPDDWQVTATDATHHGGQVGVTHLNQGTVNDWAWFSVGTGGLPAERAPGDVFDPGDDAALAEVAISPSAPVTNPGGEVALTASAVWDDGNGFDVTTTSEWSSADDEIATVTDDGVVTGVADGVTEITATYEDVSGTVTLTVDEDHVPTDPGSHQYETGQVTTSTGGMVSSADALASDAGAQTLAEGGNAVDAAVATAFALAVVEPTMSHLGGRSQMLVRLPDGEHVAIDGGTEVPSNYDPDLAPPSHASGRGYGTIALPGVVAALMEAHERYGTLPRDTVMAPAIELADDGFALAQRQAENLAEFATVDDPQYEAAQSYFLRADGTPYAAGDLLVQDDLADVLRAIADDGADVFYEGWIADAIAEDMAEFGGFLTNEELAGYEALEGTVISGTYEDYDLHSMYTPARGQVTIQALQMMAHFDMDACATEAGWVSVAHQAYRIGMADRNLPPTQVTSPEHAEQRARDIVDHCDPNADQEAPGSGIGTTTATPPWPYTDDLDPEAESPDTTHMSTADPDGMAVAFTQTLGPANGSMVATEGLGFLYASTMGYAGSTPGTRPSTNLTPMIVEHDDDLAYVLGAAGGARIVTGVLSTLARMFDEDISLAEAMAAPRFHSTGDGSLSMERDAIADVYWPDSTLDGLRGLDYAVSTQNAQNFGRVHAVHYDADAGVFTGVADPRREGRAAGP